MDVGEGRGVLNPNLKLQFILQFGLNGRVKTRRRRVPEVSLWADLHRC